MVSIGLSQIFKIQNNLRDDLLSAKRGVAEARRALNATLIDSHALMIEADRIINSPTRRPISTFDPEITNEGAYNMANVLPFPKTDRPSEEPIKALLLCPLCNIEMHLFGIESASDARDLYTFECVACGGLEVRAVK